MVNKKNIIQPIPASFEEVVKKLAASKKAENSLLEAKFRGELPIGGIKLDCAVLSDGSRILSQSSVFAAFGRPRRANSRLEIEGIKVPAFMDAKNLKPFITQDVIKWIKPIAYLDGKRQREGYASRLLLKMCDVYLDARRAGVLTSSQQGLAAQSEIILRAFGEVGVDAAIDEATGYQIHRGHDGLRMLLAGYIAEGLQKWLKTFPDDFFAELDRLYEHEPTSSRNRPQFYGKFINKYIYEPLEHGYVKRELDKHNITPEGKRIARFHQWLNEGGRIALATQLGRILGFMQLSRNKDNFKNIVQKHEVVSVAPYLFDDMNKIIE